MASDLRVLPSRRTVIATIGTGVAALLTQRPEVQAGAAKGPVQAQGFVRDAATPHDSSASNLGIPGVMVSNGRDVTLSDSTGFWSLPVDHGDCVFVVKPPHWRYLQTAGIPQFYYVYQPEGTPHHLNLAGPSIEPTGPLPPVINFYLVRAPEPDAFDALLVADTQAANASELDYVRQDLSTLVHRTGAHFAISHGDVMGDDLSLLPCYRDMLNDTGLVWHHCPGNHDLNIDSTDPKFAFEAWKRFVGPPYYAFQHAGATFILLNNVDFLGRGATAANGRAYRGAIGERQLMFVQNVLKHVPDDQLVVVSMHIPLVSFESPEDPSDTTVDRRALLEILAQRPNTLSFSGHSHTTEHHYLGSDDGFDRTTPHHHHVLTAFCGSWWSGPHDSRGIPIADSRDGSPRGYHMLSVRGHEYSTRFVPLTSSSEPDMRVVRHMPDAARVTPGAQPLDTPMRAPHLLVDVFDGGPRTSVICDVSGPAGVSFELSPSRIADPYIIETFANHRERLKPWVEAAVSSHIWTAPIPGNLQPGTYACSIRVTTEYGEEQCRPYSLTLSA